MSLSVPQNGVKADTEPVIELFVKVRPQQSTRLRLTFFYQPIVRKFVLFCHVNKKKKKRKQAQLYVFVFTHKSVVSSDAGHRHCFKASLFARKAGQRAVVWKSEYFSFHIFCLCGHVELQCRRQGGGSPLLSLPRVSPCLGWKQGICSSTTSSHINSNTTATQRLACCAVTNARKMIDFSNNF